MDRIAYRFSADDIVKARAMIDAADRANEGGSNDEEIEVLWDAVAFLAEVIEACENESARRAGQAYRDENGVEWTPVATDGFDGTSGMCSDCKGQPVAQGYENNDLCIGCLVNMNIAAERAERRAGA